MSPVSKAQQKAVAKYSKENYDTYLVRLPKGHKATIQAAAEQEGESINGYTNKALLARMGLEEWPKKEDEVR